MVGIEKVHPDSLYIVPEHLAQLAHDDDDCRWKIQQHTGVRIPTPNCCNPGRCIPIVQWGYNDQDSEEGEGEEGNLIVN
ncbi:hypothetical protein, partial [Escherichia coli]|uniref:hypothetical protein n=1 Tax=Escherichia coli TaxID=562 RepID=UPI0024AF86B5